MQYILANVPFSLDVCFKVQLASIFHFQCCVILPWRTILQFVSIPFLMDFCLQCFHHEQCCSTHSCPWFLVHVGKGFLATWVGTLRHMVWLNKTLLQHSHAHVFNGYWCAVRAELSHCDRRHVAREPEIFAAVLFTEEVCEPLFQSVCQE